MLIELGGETLIARAWRTACEAFGAENCVVAIPASDENGPLSEHLISIDASVDGFRGDENDVLGRFHGVAHFHRWHPDTVIVRYTPDDPFKSVEALRRVAGGERFPVELGGEAFTLAMLDAAQERETLHLKGWQWTSLGVVPINPNREHITDALFPFRSPTLKGAGWTIDTPADYEAAKARVAA